MLISLCNLGWEQCHCVSWMIDLSQMGVPLYYEVSLGTQVGSAAVTRWKEPLETDSLLSSSLMQD